MLSSQQLSGYLNDNIASKQNITLMQLFNVRMKKPSSNDNKKTAEEPPVSLTGYNPSRALQFGLMMKQILTTAS